MKSLITEPTVHDPLLPILIIRCKPLKNNEPQHVRENTSKVIKSTFEAIGLVSVQEVLTKCSFLATPATTQQRFVLSGQWM